MHLVAPECQASQHQGGLPLTASASVAAGGQQSETAAARYAVAAVKFAVAAVKFAVAAVKFAVAAVKFAVAAVKFAVAAVKLGLIGAED